MLRINFSSFERRNKMVKRTYKTERESEKLSIELPSGEYGILVSEVFSIEFESEELAKHADSLFQSTEAWTEGGNRRLYEWLLTLPTDSWTFLGGKKIGEYARAYDDSTEFQEAVEENKIENFATFDADSDRVYNW
jgi:hypothetical protein